MKLGPHTLKNPWILAPMAGVSEMPYRVIALEMGAAAAPTELVSAKGLLYGQDRTARYLTHAESEKPFWVQIFGGDPESMAAGAEKAVELGAHILDINMGCPVRKVTKNGAGSALLSDPKRAASLVAAMVKRVDVPVTVKIRSGWDAHSINCVDMAKAVADAGATAIAMHARTRAQAYSGKADWSLISHLVEHSPIPVIGNGDIFEPEDARRMLRETGCQAAMIGRGALGNPWIFSRLVYGEQTKPTPTMRWALIKRHFNAHLSFMGDTFRAVKCFRKHLMWYCHGLNNATSFRRQVTQIDEVEPLLEFCESFFSQAENDERHAQAEVSFNAKSALG